MRIDPQFLLLWNVKFGLNGPPSTFWLHILLFNENEKILYTFRCSNDNTLTLLLEEQRVWKFVPLPTEGPVPALANRLWQKQHRASFQNSTLRNWQHLLPVSWKTLSGSPRLPCNKFNYLATIMLDNLQAGSLVNASSWTQPSKLSYQGTSHEGERSWTFRPSYSPVYSSMMSVNSTWNRRVSQLRPTQRPCPPNCEIQWNCLTRLNLEVIAYAVILKWINMVKDC